jgi:hypothetical protein
MHSSTRMTRGQLAAFLRRNGIPIGDSTLDKLCMPTVNEGPPVAAWWGRRPLYDPADALAWAEARMRRGRTRRSKVSRSINLSRRRRHKKPERDGSQRREKASDIPHI